MKYYSEKTKKFYDKVDELETAEKKYDDAQAAEKQKQAKRAERAKEVKDAYNNAEKLLQAFIKDYGTYYDVKTSDSLLASPFTLFDILFR